MRQSAVGSISGSQVSASLRPAMSAILLAVALLACSRTAPAGNPNDVNNPGTPSTGTPGGTGAALQSITVAPPAASVPRGGTQVFTATGHFTDGSTAALPLATWSSANEPLASIDVGTGAARGVAEGGPVTVTATDPATGVTGSAVLTVLPAALQVITLTPSDAALDVGTTRQFVATGRYTDGSSAELSILSWTSSDRAVANVSGGGLVGAVAAGGPVTITATDRATGISGSATASVALPAPVVPVALTHFDGTAGVGEGRFTVSGLDPTVDYLVRVTSASPTVDPKVLTAAVAQDATYAQRLCRSWAAGPPCRAGLPSAKGELFVGVSAPEGTAFTIDVAPLPVLRPGDPAASGTVQTEAYHKLVDLAPGAVQPTLAGLTDVAADLFTYDGLRGPFGAGLLCSTVRELALPTKSCLAGVPASGVTYVTVEGWLTASGTDYALSIAQ